MDDIKDIREKKKRELMNQSEESQELEEQREAEKETVIKKLVDEEGRKRLNAVKMVKPELVNQVEEHIYQMHNAGRLDRNISEDEIIDILSSLDDSGDNYDIKMR